MSQTITSRVNCETQAEQEACADRYRRAGWKVKVRYRPRPTHSYEKPFVWGVIAKKRKPALG